jgi:hypothetical protein
LIRNPEGMGLAAGSRYNMLLVPTGEPVHFSAQPVRFVLEVLSRPSSASCSSFSFGDPVD